jgi:hypothetical protein
MQKVFSLLLGLLVIFSCQIKNKSKTTETNLVKKYKTEVSIVGEKFYINGKPTFEGRTWQGFSVEGLLPNSRMVQGVFDDLNPETVSKWKYPDTGTWDADRNTNEFIAAMESWRKHGLMAFTINLQGGSPEGYSAVQPWENNAFESDGTLRPAFAERMENFVKKADQLGMVVVLGIFYFGQDERLTDENAVISAVDNTISWVTEKGFTNIVIEVANECNNRKYDHAIIKQDRIHELILRIKEKAPELLVSTSFNGNTLPPDKVAEVSDFIILHGNGVHNPERITEMVGQVRELPSYKPMPIVFNEDDHFDFDKPVNNFVNATKAYASWGYFDFRMKDEGFDEGYQSVPVNWEISSERKMGFFNKVKEIFMDPPLNTMVFNEKNGIVAVEAENFFQQTCDEIRKWYVFDKNTTTDLQDVDDNHSATASGIKYIEILPDTRTSREDKLIHDENFSNVPGKMAIISYKVNIENPGRYYVWARIFSTGAEDNGIHVGLNGKWPESGQRMQWCEGKNEWTWASRQRTDSVHCGEERLIYLDFSKAGEHIVSFSMREDGFEIDKFILSKEYIIPEGMGIPELILKN